MNISRPPDGFRIHFRYEKIEKAVAAESARNEIFGRAWGDLLERLKMTAHIEGRPAPHIGNGCRLFVSDPDSEAGTPRILVGYLVLGETVSIRLVVLDSGDVARILSDRIGIRAESGSNACVCPHIGQQREPVGIVGEV